MPLPLYLYKKMYYIKFGNIAFKFGLNKEKNFQ